VVNERTLDYYELQYDSDKRRELVPVQTARNEDLELIRQLENLTNLAILLIEET
jgi:hypothetical protein